MTRRSILLWAALFVSLPAAGRTQEGGAKPPPLDGKLADAVRAVVDRGAAVYNAGDVAGCCRLYEGGLHALRPLLEHRPESQKAVDAGLARAAKMAKTEDRAFALREVLDQLAAALNPPKPGEKPPAKPQEGGFALTAEEKELLDLTNQERAKQGLPALKANAKLFQAARAHSANMAKQGRLDHTLDGKGPGDRLADIGYTHAGWGENCAAGQRTPAEAVTTWMNSPGHRANILSESFTEVGLGVVAAADGTRYWTQVFGTPR